MKERQKPEEENALKNEEPSDENEPKGADDNGAAEEQTPDFLLRTLESVRKERDEYYDLLLRKQAEFDNYRKRTLRERDEARVAALTEMSKELLPVLDAAEKGLGALSADTRDPKLAGYRQGYELLLRNMRSVLEKFGVKELPALGEKFDPSVHEAVITEATDEHEEGRVLEEYRKGYTISDRLLRPAQVKVAVPTPVDSD
ncbi:MAG: nucleotide exchange factor GrpE [Acidobacteria bacterium]|nr:MAG: nucleotide exchange factor GrpE [Acidobacteriota bacterium]